MTTPGSDAAHTQTVRDDLLPGLRGWQKDAYHEYFRLPRRDFLLVATPGAGKTAYALTVAAELLARREIAFLTVVTPTEHLKHQWAAAAARFGIAIDSAYRNAQGRAGADFAGVAVTYAQVAAHPALHRQRTENRRTLVIFDEIHHAGDALSWGDAVKEAFDPARRRLALTGTPFRSDANPIPFVTYLDELGGGRRSASDYVYGYGPALEDGVVRPVIFLAYSGEMRWRTRAGDEISATLGTPMTKDQIAQAWRTALDPAGEWVSRVLEAARVGHATAHLGQPLVGGFQHPADPLPRRVERAPPGLRDLVFSQWRTESSGDLVPGPGAPAHLAGVGQEDHRAHYAVLERRPVAVHVIRGAAMAACGLVDVADERDGAGVTAEGRTRSARAGAGPGRRPPGPRHPRTARRPRGGSRRRRPACGGSRCAGGAAPGGPQPGRR